jgi:hypothetical protein
MSLMELFIKWVCQWLFGVQNWAIRSIKLTYQVKEYSEQGPVSVFWRTQNLSSGTVKTIEVRDKKWKPVPSFVDIKALAINYWYDGKTFTYVPEDKNFQWPPTKGASFTLPIKHALVYDDNDECVMDVTDIVKRLAGPKNNTSVFKRFKKLVITNVLDQSSSTFVAK